VSPVREIKGGLWMIDPATDALVCRPAALRLLRQREQQRCHDIARQYLASRGDGTVSLSSLATLTNLLGMHLALVVPSIGPGRATTLFPNALAGLTNDKGKIVDNAALLIESLPLQDLAEGQLDALASEYDLLRTTETPAAITHEQWERIVAEGKAESLRTLILRHGSSALIQVLHGMPVEAWRE
jgi:hypothetical protein